MIKTDSVLKDLKSGFFISLIALPLCLGIAIASSFPPIAGVMTAIVGGIIVSFVGSSSLAIKGPAAGLIVIVLAAVTDLGAGDLALGYRRTLAVGVVAGLLQIVFALCKTGRFGRIIPPSVINGMLAAIGIIIVSKQFHVFLGATPHAKKPLDLIAEIPTSIMNVNPELALIGIFVLFLMIGMPLIPHRAIKSIPPAFVAMLVVIPLGLFWELNNPRPYNFLDQVYEVGPEFFVNIPNNLLHSVVFPDFSILKSLIAYKYVLMLALVGAIESVLTVIAIDSITKTKEKSDLDRDLLGIGIGNLICSLIGGLPMISEVVRSKANIDSGAKSSKSNFFHGVFLLLGISMLAPIIREIPLSALAAMLLITGFRLAAPAQFKKTYNIGPDQLTLFVATLMATLATDLLVGVFVGIAIKFAFHIYRGVKPNQMFHATISIKRNGKTTSLLIEGPVIFSNYFSLQKQLMREILTADRVEIDFSRASLIDHTTLSCLQDVRDQLGEQKLSITGLDKLVRLSQHQLSTHKFA